MKRLGFFENPQNWTLGNDVFINLRTKKINSLSTARKTIKENPSQIVLPPNYIFNPFTQRIVKRSRRTEALARPYITTDITQSNDFLSFYNQVKNFIESIPYPEYDLTATRPNGSRLDFVNPRLNDVIESIKVQIYRDGEDLQNIDDITLTAFQINPQVPRNLTQVFREGETNCLLTPIKQLYEKSHAETTSDKRRQTLKRFINLTNKLLSIYADGVPQSKLQEVANTLEVKIIIKDFFGNPLFETQSVKNSRYRVIYRNTYLNHTETICDSIFEIETQTEMNEIKLRNKSRFYLCRKSGDKIMELQTAEGTYRYKIENDPINKFITDLNINGINIHTDVAKFIQSGTVITSHSFVNKNTDQTDSQTLDMERAYAYAPKHSPYYQGFPATITGLYEGDFTLDFVKNHIGYYEITDITIPAHLRGFSKMLNLGTSRVLPSPEIIFFADNGFTFNIVRGAFGFARDIEMPDYMFEKVREIVYDHRGNLGEITTTPYKNLVGRLCMYQKLFYKRYEFNTNLPNDFVSFLRTKYSDAKFTRDAVYIPQPNATTRNFVGGFYTSYTRIELLNQVFKSNPADIIAVCLDSITYLKDTDIPSHSSLWRLKPSKQYTTLADTFYPEFYRHCCETPELPTCLSRVQIWNGQGGSGKTHTAIQMYPNLTYVAPTNLICASVWKNYGVRTYTTYALLGETPEDETPNDYKIKSVGNPHIILLDEITMIPDKTIEKIIERFPYSQIILAGDINEKCEPYQATFGDDSFKNTHNYPFITFTTDRRSQDEELKSMKLKIRECIDNKEYFIVKPDIHITDLPSQYNNDTDYIIGYTNKMNTQITEMLPECQSYYITKTHKFRDQMYYKGQISKNEKPMFAERRVCFTTHSVQGRTIEQPSKLFIVLQNGMFLDTKILYTAVSRVRNFSQLVFVGLSPFSSP